MLIIVIIAAMLLGGFIGIFLCALAVDEIFPATYFNYLLKKRDDKDER